MPYRADIDGLRAVSVLAVVLYHAGVPLAGGGFVGVDVFFVISGFLITSLILHEQAAGAFSLVSFYHRRIRRILPALFVMMMFCLAVGWFLLAQADYWRLGKSVMSAAVSLSNFEFWRDAGYFDTPAAEKPLLHTWSLGVEEQFYLVFPLYLILVARYLPRRRLQLTAVICAISFAIGAVEAFRHPVAAFYLPHARLWELLVGGLLAMGALPPLVASAARGAAGLIGLGLVAAAVFGYSGDTTFPGLAALPPTLGAALIIWSGMKEPALVGRALAAPPLAFIGRISYSLYLWHFPLLAFGLYAGLGALAPAETAGLLALAFVLALLSWRFVEQPARRAGARLPWRSVAIYAASGSFALAWAGLAVQLADGVPARLPERQDRLADAEPLRNPDRDRCYVADIADIRIDRLCPLGGDRATPGSGLSFVLWGDSHGEALRGALDVAAGSSGRLGVFAGEKACPPLVGVARPRRPECRAISEAYLRLIVETPSVRTVVLAARWGWWAEGPPYKREAGAPVKLVLGETSSGATDNHAALAAGLEQTVAALIAAGKRVWLVGPVPEVGYDVPRYFHLRALGLAEGLEIAPSLADFSSRQAFVLGLFGELARRYPIGTVWPHQGLCDDAGCDIIRNGHLLYGDDDHLSVFGARSLAGMFAPVFEQGLGATLPAATAGVAPPAGPATNR